MGIMNVSTSNSTAFNFGKVGDVCVGTIKEIADEVKTVNEGREQTNLVLTVAIDGAKSTSHNKEKDPVALEDGEERAIWIGYHRKKLVSAVQEALRAAGVTEFAIGGTVTIKYDSAIPNTDPKKSATKVFKAKYAPPAAIADDDF